MSWKALMPERVYMIETMDGQLLVDDETGQLVRRQLVDGIVEWLDVVDVYGATALVRVRGVTAVIQSTPDTRDRFEAYHPSDDE